MKGLRKRLGIMTVAASACVAVSVSSTGMSRADAAGDIFSQFSALQTKANLGFSYKSASRDSYSRVEDCQEIGEGDVFTLVYEVGNVGYAIGEQISDTEFDVIPVTISRNRSGDKFYSEAPLKTFTVLDGNSGFFYTDYCIEDGTDEGMWEVYPGDDESLAIYVDSFSWDAIYFNPDAGEHGRFEISSDWSDDPENFYNTYLLTGSETSYDFSVEGQSSISMSFVGFIDAELKDALDDYASDLDEEITYGVFYAASNNGSYIANAFEDYEDEYIYYYDSLDEYLEDQEIYSKGAIVGVDSTGLNIMDDDPTHYIFGVNFNNISLTKLKTYINAVAYVRIGDEVTLMDSRFESVKSLAAKYVAASDKSAYEAHLPALTYLSKL